MPIFKKTKCRMKQCYSPLRHEDDTCDKFCIYNTICVQTNADRIRAMTDEELDKFLGEVQWDVANYCGGVTQKQEYPVPEQRGAWLEWLKKEVDNVSIN